MTVACVMVPGFERDWYRKDATWYIIVKASWDLIWFYIYNESEFAEYLFESIRLDTPSTSRYWIWVIHKENDDSYIYLNLQLRFI